MSQKDFQLAWTRAWNLRSWWWWQREEIFGLGTSPEQMRLDSSELTRAGLLDKWSLELARCDITEPEFSLPTTAVASPGTSSNTVAICSPPRGNAPMLAACVAGAPADVMKSLPSSHKAIPLWLHNWWDEVEPGQDSPGPDIRESGDHLLCLSVQVAHWELALVLFCGLSGPVWAPQSFTKGANS